MGFFINADHYYLYLGGILIVTIIITIINYKRKKFALSEKGVKNDWEFFKKVFIQINKKNRDE